MHASFRRGLRLGIPFAVVGFVLSMSFGVLAIQAGFNAAQAIVMSAIVFGGSAQFAAAAIVGAGGGLVPGVLAASLMNSRFLAMGIAIAPSLPGGPVTRAVQGQAVVDSSWAIANEGDGRFDRWVLIGTTAPQYVAWLCGTAVGAFAGDLIGDTDRFGLDAVYPTFFLALLVAELRDRRTRPVALAGVAIALTLVPFTPPGIPILAAGVASLVGLRR